eukprot:SAG22_NODE_2760_length_2236_cov_302.510529_3_plen_170_part_00
MPYNSRSRWSRRTRKPGRSGRRRRWPRPVRTKALSFCCAPTGFLSKAAPFLAVPQQQRRRRSSCRTAATRTKSSGGGGRCVVQSVEKKPMFQPPTSDDTHLRSPVQLWTSSDTFEAPSNCGLLLMVAAPAAGGAGGQAVPEADRDAGELQGKARHCLPFCRASTSAVAS